MIEFLSSPLRDFSLMKSPHLQNPHSVVLTNHAKRKELAHQRDNPFSQSRSILIRAFLVILLIIGLSPLKSYATACTNTGALAAPITGPIPTTWSTSMPPTSFSWDRDIAIRPGATLIIDGITLSFAKDVHIIVENGGKLILQNGAKLTAMACSPNYIWGGVIVDGDINTPQNSTTGKISIYSNSIIERAYIGVNLAADYNKNGGIIVAKDAIFRNCRKAVQFMQYEYPNASNFIRCQFYSDIFLYPNPTVNDDSDYFAASVFVSLWNVQGIKFIGCDFENKIPKVNFDPGIPDWTATKLVTNTDWGLNNRSIGIGAIDASFDVDEYVDCGDIGYIGDPNGCPPPNCPVIHSKFSHLYRGIYAEDISKKSFRQVNIKFADFLNNYQDIYIKNTDATFISHCNFTIDNDYGNWALRNMNSGRKGVCLDGCERAEVSACSFDITEDSDNGGYDALTLRNTSSIESRIHHNSFKSRITYGQCGNTSFTSMYFIGKNGGASIRCNDFDNRPLLPSGEVAMGGTSIHISDMIISEDESTYEVSGPDFGNWDCGSGNNFTDFSIASNQDDLNNVMLFTDHYPNFEWNYFSCGNCNNILPLKFNPGVSIFNIYQTPLVNCCPPVNCRHFTRLIDGQPNMPFSIDQDSVSENHQTYCTVYPVPASNLIHIKYELNQDANCKLKIISITGKCLIQKQLISPKDDIEIDISTLSKGMYFVFIGNQTKEITHAKFIVQ